MRRSTLSSIVAVALAPAIVIVSACGGAQSIDFGHTVDSGSGSGGGSGSSSGVSSEDSGASTSDAGQAPMDAVAVIDVIEPMDVTPVEEPAPTGPAVLCPSNGNPMTCNTGEVCCVTGDPAQGTQTDTCQSSGSPCSGGTLISCASKADCPGSEVCCGTEQTDPQTMMVTYTGVSCAPSCAGTNKRIFCDPMAPGTCPTATPVCGQSQLLPGYTVCQM
jgi:hypothetical protein